MSKFGLFRLSKKLCSINSRIIRPYSADHYDHHDHHDHHDRPHWLTVSDKPHINNYYDDAYTPEGDFYEHYNRMNAKYNRYLAASVLLFLVSLGTYLQLGCLQLNVLNYPKCENTPEGLAFYEYGRKFFTERSDRYALEHNPNYVPPSEGVVEREE